MRNQTARAAIIASLLIGVAAGGFFLVRQFSVAPLQADPDNPAQVALGRTVYATHCASCHGVNLEGEPNWQVRKPSGRLPAPPHDASGHTWHHPDAQLFGIVKNGLTPYAPPGYQSDMPAFGSMLSDEQVWAVLAYIKSSWSSDIRERQADISKRSE
jgi:mono/diheme cytochrome c family protein